MTRTTQDGWDTTKNSYRPDGGREVREDGTILDVAGWRDRNDWGVGGTKEVIGALDRIHDEMKITNKLLRKLLDE